ncbi:MAG TPA: lipid A biosynthesis lauroyl acyltransferase, partial [Gammaproteobacteria bacterium]|nr:lipid A biosynthesis lauroyl acyltransferase [Gammaproteobacteria bacterium]
MKKRVRSPFHPKYVGSWVTLGLLRFLSKVPLPLLYHVGTLLGDLLRMAIPSRRRIAERNLALCFPERSKDEITAMARENLRNTARMLLYTG